MFPIDIFIVTTYFAIYTRQKRSSINMLDRDVSASTSKSTIDAQDNIVTPDKVGVTVESVNNSIRNDIGRSYSFDDF